VQTFSIAIVVLKSVPERLGSSLVIVTGVASMVGVLLTVLAMITGIRAVMENSGRDDRAIVLSKESGDELTGSIKQNLTHIIGDTLEVARAPDHSPLISPEMVAPVALYEAEKSDDVNVILRGLHVEGLGVWPEIRIVSGRLFAPGTAEMIVGRSAALQFPNLIIGRPISLYGFDWTVVGVFESHGNYRESELLVDASVLAGVKHGGDYQSVYALLSSKDALTDFRQSLTSNPQLKVEVLSEREYLEAESSSVNRLLNTLLWAMGSLMSLGALFAALNAMQTAISSRTRDIAVMRAIGFNPNSVAIAFVIEATLLALVGGLVGTAASWLLFNGRAATTGIGGNLPSNLMFNLQLSLESTLFGIFAGLLVGLIGGAIPAIAASRQNLQSVLGAQ
jgi:putative ABC transport system permease protein